MVIKNQTKHYNYVIAVNTICIVRKIKFQI